jgi:hypothetical protein
MWRAVPDDHLLGQWPMFKAAARRGPPCKVPLRPFPRLRGHVPRSPAVLASCCQLGSAKLADERPRLTDHRDHRPAMRDARLAWIVSAARHQHRSAGFAPRRSRARPGIGFRFLGLVGYRKTRSDNALA